MKIFAYGNKEMDYLKKRDPVLGAVIDQIGMIRREIIPDVFAALVNSIVSQQISSKAAQTIWMRVMDMMGEVTPENIVKSDVSAIQSCGVSMRKAQYIKAAGESIAQGKIDLSSFSKLSDTEIVDQLTTLKGVGIWTAEMILIFSLERKNVFSFGDLAIRKGLMNIFGLKELTPEKFDQFRKLYTPFCSVASLYIWEKSK